MLRKIHTKIRTLLAVTMLLLGIMPGTIIFAFIIAKLLSRYMIYDSSPPSRKYQFIEHNNFRNYYISPNAKGVEDNTKILPIELSNKPEIIVLYLHGRSMNASADYNHYSNVESKICKIFALEYPGYLPMQGKANAGNLQKAINNFLDYLENICLVKSKDIIICGHSLGAMHGIMTISQREEKYGKIYGGFIGFGTCMCLSEAIAYKIQNKITAMQLFGKYLKKGIEILLPKQERINAYKHYQKMKTKAYFFHGEEDSVAPHDGFLTAIKMQTGPERKIDHLRIIPHLPDEQHTSIIHIMKDILPCIAYNLTYDNQFNKNQGRTIK
ncbi:hypothetical protein CAXC1_120025 [Candidatus Xenohaliotis californiensis]|uniref:Uncharacterized protein n=1 Tax=Candidatus Xenohaliotis californiensis TaxID=84677 RepID=A0ABP0ERL6_9RICK|nr:hypothetical protein CAXC1_120025 [Candidatus Xenohaliotis californiensis]